MEHFSSWVGIVR